jgi:hypothetical protein
MIAEKLLAGRKDTLHVSVACFLSAKTTGFLKAKKIATLIVSVAHQILSYS